MTDLLPPAEIERHRATGLAVLAGLDAAILGQHPGMFVFSMHGEKNFPFRKVASTLDIALPDGTEDGQDVDPYDALVEHGVTP